MEKVIKSLVITIFLTFTFLISFGHVYTISDTGNDKIYQVLSFKELTVSEVLSKANLTTRSEDIVIPDLNESLDSGKITVMRSRPIKVTIDKQTKTYYTTKVIVSDFLNEIGVKLGPKDYINIPLNGELNTGQVIIKRYLEREKVVKESIPYKTVYVEDPMVASGMVYLRQAGQDGIKELHYKEIYFGGDKIREDFAFEKITKMPTTETYVKGTAKPPNNYVKSFYVIATAYSPTVAETDSNPWMTASGLRSGFGVVAVDPTVIPMGTLLYVEGYGYAVAGDTGGAIKGNKIDVFFYYPYEASRWGIRKVKVYILDGKWKFQGKLNY
ncbi:3D domain-containing protein [Caldisericum exile]|uniref:3D domain-containing protein n=1 Tax=Caldisericum exile TaxID=693075 RepID=UPI00155B08AA|nr:3D domain-containing protein [Caldisericum exile]